MIPSICQKVETFLALNRCIYMHALFILSISKEYMFLLNIFNELVHDFVNKILFYMIIYKDISYNWHITIFLLNSIFMITYLHLKNYKHFDIFNVSNFLVSHAVAEPQCCKGRQLFFFLDEFFLMDFAYPWI